MTSSSRYERMRALHCTVIIILIANACNAFWLKIETVVIVFRTPFLGWISVRRSCHSCPLRRRPSCQLASAQHRLWPLPRTCIDRFHGTLEVALRGYIIYWEHTSLFETDPVIIPTRSLPLACIRAALRVSRAAGGLPNLGRIKGSLRGLCR